MSHRPARGKNRYSPPDLPPLKLYRITYDHMYVRRVSEIWADSQTQAKKEFKYLKFTGARILKVELVEGETK